MLQICREALHLLEALVKDEACLQMLRDKEALGKCRRKEIIESCSFHRGVVRYDHEGARRAHRRCGDSVNRGQSLRYVLEIRSPCTLIDVGHLSPVALMAGDEQLHQTVDLMKDCLRRLEATPGMAMPILRQMGPAVRHFAHNLAACCLTI